MRSSTLRTMVLGITILLVLVMGVQLYWLNKTYALEEKEFNVKVNSALRSVVEAIRFSHHDTTPFAGEITQPKRNYFVANTKYEADTEEIEFLLKKAIEEYNIFTSFKFGIYNKNTGKMEHIEYVPFPETSKRYADKPLPQIQKPYNYVGVFFPNRKTFIIHEMGFWIFSTLLLLIIIIGFGISLFKFFKQRQLSEIQKDFINNMTHEFRTPISTIQLSTEVLKGNQNIQSNQRLFQYTHIIENEANHLENQVERVLQVAKMENHPFHLEKDYINVHEILRQVTYNFENNIKQKEGHFEQHLNATHPVIVADKLHFTNIFFNLIDNAIKYSSHPHITISTEDHKKGILIFIKDNGPGISKKYQKFLFTKFFRVPTGNIHEVKGFGLGLNYVKLYTRAFGGKITLSSEPGKGCTFVLYFPKVSF